MSKTIIFDLDGTLIDATEGIVSSVQYLIKKHNLKPISKETLLTFVGPPIQESLKKTYNVTEEEAQTLANTFRQKYKDGDVYKATVYDGIFQLLKRLKNNNYKTGIATYKREDYAISLVKHLGLDKFIDLTCGADNENKLTKKDILRKCMRELNSPPENTIFVGDSLSDGVAAKALGCGFIAIMYGFGFNTKDDTVECCPVSLVSKVSDFEAILFDESSI